MRCPFCSKDNDSVRDSRTIDDGRSIRRRRICNFCKRKFTTFERIEGSLLVVKKDGTRENFQRDKIEQGFIRACWKRPVSAEQVQEMVQAVENQVLDDYEGEVSSEEIGSVSMQVLSQIDQVAYVRFASVYREFQDANDFVRELKPILRTGQ